MRASIYPGIIKWCSANGYSIKRLASAVDIEYKYLLRRLYGDTKMSLEEALRICKVTGLDVKDFF